jgi:uncharacterized protein YcfJ
MKLTRTSVFTFATVALVTIGGLTLSAQQGYGYGQGQGRGRGRAAMALSGTYELDRTQGDDPIRAAQNATRTLPENQRDTAYRNLLARLQPPSTVSIERRGRTVNLASTTGPMVTFEADGQTRREQINNTTTGYGAQGRPVTLATRAVFVGDRLTISSTGNRATDFTVTFEPLQGGDRMLVTRQIYNANYRQPVITRTYYTRVSTEPRWDVYNANAAGNYDPRGDRRDPRYDPRVDTRNTAGAVLLVPEGTLISAVLDTPIDTRTARAGDRFTMTVVGPFEYRDARIEGVIRAANVSQSDRPADLRVDFDTIRLRNGQTGTLDATLDTVRKPGGEVLRVDGTIQDNKDTNPVQTGAIGAAIGGVIGVLTGGTKGAVIGAVIGGAAGAGGAILANQRDRYLDLPIGTEVTIVTGYRSTGGR